jgi:hypothetical protein
MDKNKLYYLSHPYTTFGDPKKNIISARVIEFALFTHHDLKVVNPIILPLGTTNDEAMDKCRHLYNACDAIILCEGWELSKGCMEEYKWALEDGKPIYLAKKGEGNKYHYILIKYEAA